MARPLPPNFPTSMTGVEIFQWICDGEKFGFVYPDDYVVNGGPATMDVDLTQTYSVQGLAVTPSKGYIHQMGTNDLVQAVEITSEVAARLSAGGGVANEEIIDLVNSWSAGPNTVPDSKKVLDISRLIGDKKVDY